MRPTGRGHAARLGQQSGSCTPCCSSARANDGRASLCETSLSRRRRRPHRASRRTQPGRSSAACTAWCTGWRSWGSSRSTEANGFQLDVESRAVMARPCGTKLIGRLVMQTAEFADCKVALGLRCDPSRESAPGNGDLFSGPPSQRNSVRGVGVSFDPASARAAGNTPGHSERSGPERFLRLATALLVSTTPRLALSGSVVPAAADPPKPRPRPRLEVGSAVV